MDPKFGISHSLKIPTRSICKPREKPKLEKIWSSTTVTHKWLTLLLLVFHWQSIGTGRLRNVVWLSLQNQKRNGNHVNYNTTCMAATHGGLTLKLTVHWNPEPFTKRHMLCNVRNLCNWFLLLKSRTFFLHLLKFMWFDSDHLFWFWFFDFSIFTLSWVIFTITSRFLSSKYFIKLLLYSLKTSIEKLMYLGQRTELYSIRLESAFLEQQWYP